MTSLLEEQVARAGLAGIHAKLLTGERLDSEDGLQLNRSPDLTAVGSLANLVRERVGGDRTCMVRNLHINYTNICNKLRKFCSFYAAPNAQDGKGYALSPAEAAARVGRYADEPIREIHGESVFMLPLPRDRAPHCRRRLHPRPSQHQVRTALVAGR